MKRAIVIGSAVVVVFAASIFAWNYEQLQVPMNQVLAEDPRNDGLTIRTHYSHFVNPGILVYDLRHVPEDKSRLDVMRALLQYASHLKGEQFDSVVLAYRGDERFMLKGS